MISQGTMSVLFGCHSVIIHSIIVIVAWKRLHGKRPDAWQIVCIFLHDVGHLGLNYLDDFEAKKKHWMLGASIAYSLFGQKGFDFLAGHCSHSGYPLSDLYRADKYSWHIAPYWWLYWNNIAEPTLKQGMTNRAAILQFQETVRKSVESGEFRSTHEMFLERCKNRER